MSFNVFTIVSRLGSTDSTVPISVLPFLSSPFCPLLFVLCLDDCPQSDSVATAVDVCLVLSCLVLYVFLDLVL